MQRAVFASIEDLHAAVGQTVAVSDPLTVTQLMIDEFADLSGDRQWIHLDAERAARESPFGTTIAHGFLVLSLLTPLIEQCVALPPVRLALNYGFDRVRFISPVPVGAQIIGRFGVHTVSPTADGVQIAWNAEIAVRDALKPALAALWLSRLILP